MRPALVLLALASLATATPLVKRQERNSGKSGTWTCPNTPGCETFNQVVDSCELSLETPRLVIYCMSGRLDAFSEPCSSTCGTAGALLKAINFVNEDEPAAVKCLESRAGNSDACNRTTGSKCPVEDQCQRANGAWASCSRQKSVSCLCSNEQFLSDVSTCNEKGASNGCTVSYSKFNRNWCNYSQDRATACLEAALGDDSKQGACNNSGNSGGGGGGGGGNNGGGNNGGGSGGGQGSGNNNGGGSGSGNGSGSGSGGSGSGGSGSGNNNGGGSASSNGSTGGSSTSTNTGTGTSKTSGAMNHFTRREALLVPFVSGALTLLFTSL